MGIVYLADKMGVSVAGYYDGDFLVTEVSTDRALFDEINKFSPTEVICNDAFSMSGISLEDLKTSIILRYLPWIPISSRMRAAVRCCGSILRWEAWRGLALVTMTAA